VGKTTQKQHTRQCNATRITDEWREALFYEKENDWCQSKSDNCITGVEKPRPEQHRVHETGDKACCTRKLPLSKNQHAEPCTKDQTDCHGPVCCLERREEGGKKENEWIEHRSICQEGGKAESVQVIPENIGGPQTFFDECDEWVGERVHIFVRPDVREEKEFMKKQKEKGTISSKANPW